MPIQLRLIHEKCWQKPARHSSAVSIDLQAQRRTPSPTSPNLEALLNGHPQSKIEDLMPWRFRNASSLKPQGFA